MDWKQMLIQQVIGLLSGFLLRPAGAAKYVKYLIMGRDYLLLLVPLETYPTGYYAGLTERAKADPSAFAIVSDTKATADASASKTTGAKTGRLTIPERRGARRAASRKTAHVRGAAGTRAKRR